MTRQGGAWAKAGITYEGHWTVRHMLHLIDRRAERMRVEDPGPRGEGVEFWLETAAKQVEHHQAKRQHGERGKWSLHELRRSDILKVIDEKLSDPQAVYVFVSEHAAFPLDRLCEEAELSPDAATFKSQCDSVGNYRWETEGDAAEFAVAARRYVIARLGAKPAGPSTFELKDGAVAIELEGRSTSIAYAPSGSRLIRSR